MKSPDDNASSTVESSSAGESVAKSGNAYMNTTSLPNSLDFTFTSFISVTSHVERKITKEILYVHGSLKMITKP